MPVVISLLRGINVGGNSQVSMETLGRIYENLGVSNVRTYINSGNVLFESKKSDFARWRQLVRNGLKEACGFEPEVIFRTALELDEAIKKNPFAGRPDIDPKKLLVVFFNSEPGKAACKQLMEIDAPEEVHILDRECFIYFPNGLARPKLSWTAVEKKLGVAGTGRNWNTVLKLAELARAEARAEVKPRRKQATKGRALLS